MEEPQPTPLADILVADDEAGFREAFCQMLRRRGYCVTPAGTVDEIISAVRAHGLDLVTLDLEWPSFRTNGVEILKQIQQVDPLLPVVMLTGYATISTAVEATRLGAFDYLEKITDREKTLLTVRNAIESGRLKRRIQRVLTDRQREWTIVGVSKGIAEVREAIEKYGPSDVTVLLEGETGCGKELVAGQLHLHSNRSDSEMVVVSGAELNSHLGQDALFGHTHGAYTGTARDREGFVKAADHGTLFLDDVSDLSPEVQPLLLRFLETGDFMRLGSDERQRVDVRVIAATNHNLSELIKQGKIRSDLYYRLQVATIKVPPLRDRREDIPLLVEHFARRQSIRLLGREITLDAECVDHFISRNWPGNVRELRNAVIRVILTHGAREKITSSEVRAVLDQESGGTPVMHGTLGELETEFRRDCIIHALNVAGGNITRAAETLGVDRARLSRLISEFNLRDFARHLAE